MKNSLKRISLFCGIALTMLAAFPVFAQDYFRPNKKPLQDFAKTVIDRVQSGDVVLNNNFLTELEGELTKDGKLDFQKTKYVRSEGDEKMIDVAKSAIEAVNDTGILFYLAQLDVKKLNIILAQDNDQIYTLIKSEFPTLHRARTSKSAWDLMLKMASMQSRDKDEKVFLDGTVISIEDKTATIKTAVAKSVGQEMIQRKLNEEINKRLEQEKAK